MSKLTSLFSRWPRGSLKLFFLKTAFTFLIFSLLYRLGFFFSFFEKVNSIEYLESLYLGFKFDLRLLSLQLLIPGFLFLIIPKKVFKKFRALKVFIYLLWFTALLPVHFLYFMDFGHYSYLQKRVNLSVVDNFENPYISLEMAYQSYPLITIILVLIFIVFLNLFLLQKFLNEYLFYEYQQSKRKLVLERFSCFAVIVILFYGKISYYPLRWSEAYFSPNNFISQWTLNPFLNFAETAKFEKNNFDAKTVQYYYPLVSEFLGITKKDTEKLNFKRGSNASPSSSPNIVIIQLESLAANRSSVFNNKLDPTPKLQEWSEKSYLFKKFFTATEATARAVWAAITGLPDIATSKSSSRNPHLVDQKTVMADFKGYSKYYFLGGSANWGNIRSIFSNNVSDIKIYEEGSFSSKSERVDVWGISDLDLFKEAHNVLKKESKPFIAYIQSAGFHRPYTIPQNNDGFELKNYNEQEILNNGFISLEEYNSLRFQDHAFGIFMDLAKKSKYYKNTIFIVFGDHGIPVVGKSQNMPEGYYKHRLVLHHVPLLIHFPKKLKKGEDDSTIGSLVDLLPTAASLAGISWETKTLGRDLFRPRKPHQNYAFIFSWHMPITTGLIGKEFYFENRNNEDKLYKYENSEDPFKLYNDENNDQFRYMKDLTKGLYETTKYLRYHNKKRP